MLKGCFTDEPGWIDLRPYRGGAIRRDSKFADLAADFAAAIHGVPKEDLLSEEVRQQRFALSLAWSAVAALLLFLALAAWQWRTAEAQRRRAERTLALATQTANSLVFDLAQKFRNKGLPAALSADILDRASKLQSQLTAGGETSAILRRSQAVALNEKAITLLTLGKADDALAAAKESNDISEALATSNPTRTSYQVDLSTSLERIGDVQQVQGDLAGARESYGGALAIIDRLAKSDPGNSGWQRDLSVSYEKLGEV